MRKDKSVWAEEVGGRERRGGCRRKNAWSQVQGIQCDQEMGWLEH